MNDKRITEGHCSGCHACYSVCTKRAITMSADGEGFLYPRIDATACVNCGLCYAVCPVNHPTKGVQRLQQVCAAINTDDTARMHSSSGGVFVLLADAVIQRGGVVYGAGFDKHFAVEHQRVESDPWPLQTSKYVQSRMGDTLQYVEEDLRNGRQVLFVGTPCQVAGVHAYVTCRRLPTDRLLLIDLICHGVPSPMVWERHLAQISAGRTPKMINFRDKSYSWGGFALKVAFTDGSEYKELASADFYMQGFFANLTLRPSCYDCTQKTVDRVSDLTLADCWGVENFLLDMYDKKGTSAVLIRSDKGQQWLDTIRDHLRIQTIPLDDVVQYNYPLVQSVQPHPRRTKFFAQMQQSVDVASAIADILKPTFEDRIKGLIVSVKRLGKKILNKRRSNYVQK